MKGKLLCSRFGFAALAAAILAGAAVCPVGSRAACPTPPSSSLLANGEVGLFFDAAGTQTCAEVPVGMPVPLYLVARVPEGGVASYTISALMGQASIIISSSSPPPGAPFDVEFIIDDCSRAVKSDPQTCPAVEGDLMVLVVYQAMFFSTTGAACFQTACPLFSGITAVNPRYTRCDTGAWGEFTGGESMCLFPGGTVAADEDTWGTIKSLYAEE